MNRQIVLQVTLCYIDYTQIAEEGFIALRECLKLAPYTGVRNSADKKQTNIESLKDLGERVDCA
jgi:hypothetical protein